MITFKSMTLKRGLFSTIAGWLTRRIWCSKKSKMFHLPPKIGCKLEWYRQRCVSKRGTIRRGGPNKEFRKFPVNGAALVRSHKTVSDVDKELLRVRVDQIPTNSRRFVDVVIWEKLAISPETTNRVFDKNKRKWFGFSVVVPYSVLWWTFSLLPDVRCVCDPLPCL